MVKKIIALSIATIILVTVLGGGTWAFLRDNETSSGNVLSAGSLDLMTSVDKCVTWTNSVTQTIYATGFKPGQYIPLMDASKILTKNNGSIAGAHMDVSFSYSPVGTTTSTDAQTLAKNLKVLVIDWDRVDMQYYDPALPNVPESGINTNGNGWTDVDDLQNASNNHYFTDFQGMQPSQGIDLISLYNNGNPLDAYYTYGGELAIQLLVNTSLFSTLQGKGINVTITFTLRQN